MNIEEIKEQFEIWEDELCPTEVVRYLLSIIEQAEKAFEKILVVDLDYSCDDVEEMKSISEEALKAIRGN